MVQPRKFSKQMRRTEHLGARVLTVLGLAATFAYLVWRSVYSLVDTRLWLSVPVLLVEIVSFLGAAVLAWALWPSPVAHAVSSSEPAVPVLTDVVVRVDHQADHEVRATLLAARRLPEAAQVIVIDLNARPEIASLAVEFDALYAATDPADRNGLRTLLATVCTAQLLLLDAGDIPAGDIIPRLAAEFTDERVAVAQGLGSSPAEDSAEHGPSGRHELLFERVALNPALGARGVAIWLGSGSLLRTAALRATRLGNADALESSWLVGAALAAEGWRLTAPGDVPVLAHRTVHSEQEVFDDRVGRARAARQLVFGARGALRGRGLSSGQRLALLAWAVRPLSGLRRIAFVALLGVALLSGTVPFHGDTPLLVGAWLPSFLYTSLGIALLSGWTLRPGDRARWSLHSIGAAVTSLRSPASSRRTREPIVALPGRQYGAGLVAVVVTLSIVLLLRGVSDRVTHTLGELPQSVLMVLLMVTLWTLALSLELLRVLGRRHQLRRTARVVSSLAATMGERSVSIVDLTSLGAGLLSQTGVDVHERSTLETVIPTTSGVTTVRLPCVVRNVVLLPSGDYRIGVEFGRPDPSTANALAEFCTVEPMWEHLGVLPGQSVTDGRRTMYLDEPEAESSPGRTLVRVVSMLALLGVVASAAPSTASASASLQHRLTGSVVDTGEPPVPGIVPGVPDSVEVSVPDSLVDIDEPVATTDAPTVESAAPVGVGGVVVVGVCSLAPGDDGVWGTADDEYDTPVATVTDAEGNYALDLTGEACWATIDPPAGYTPVEVGTGEALNPAPPHPAPLNPAPLNPTPIDVSGSTSAQPTLVVQRVEATVPPPPIPAGGAMNDGARADEAAYRLGSRLRDAGDRWSAAPSQRAAQVLPAPAASQLAEAPATQSSLSFFVLALAALLAGSLLLGFARPRSGSIA